MLCGAKARASGARASGARASGASAMSGTPTVAWKKLRQRLRGRQY